MYIVLAITSRGAEGTERSFRIWDLGKPQTPRSLSVVRHEKNEWIRFSSTKSTSGTFSIAGQETNRCLPTFGEYSNEMDSIPGKSCAALNERLPPKIGMYSRSSSSSSWMMILQCKNRCHRSRQHSLLRVISRNSAKYEEPKNEPSLLWRSGVQRTGEKAPRNWVVDQGLVAYCSRLGTPKWKILQLSWNCW